MMVVARRILLALTVLLGTLAIVDSAFAQRPAYLFHIERNKNANIVVYEANLTNDGLIDAKNPASAYWVMKAEDGRREGLTSLERSHAYGFSTRVDSDRRAMWLWLVADRSHPIRVTVSERGTVRAEAPINGRRAFLQKIYVKASSGLIPSVEYIEIFGTDVYTGAQLRERRRP